MARTQQDISKKTFVKPVVTPVALDLSKVDIDKEGSLCDRSLLQRVLALEQKTNALVSYNLAKDSVTPMQANGGIVSDHTGEPKI